MQITRASPQQLVVRASYELSCPPQWLHVYTLDPRSSGVDGCGQRAVYVESCDDPRGWCTWRLESLPGLGQRPQRPALTPPPPGAPQTGPRRTDDVLDSRD